MRFISDVSYDQYFKIFYGNEETGETSATFPGTLLPIPSQSPNPPSPINIAPSIVSSRPPSMPPPSRSIPNSALQSRPLANYSPTKPSDGAVSSIQVTSTSRPPVPNRKPAGPGSCLISR